MYTLLKVHAEDIARLNPQRLTDLIDKLLVHEAVTNGIPKHSIQVGTQLNTPDGGIDAYVEWTDGPTHTEFLPCQKCAFQVKTGKGEITPSKLEREIVKNGDIKPEIERAFKSTATYILFTNQHKNTAQINRLREKFLNLLRLYSKDYADSAQIRVYAVDSIARWVNSFLPVIIDVRCWLNQPVPAGLMSWEMWNNFESRALKTQFVADEMREQVINTIRETLVVETKHLRILGLSGIGKTRLALEALTPNFNTSAPDQVVYVDTFICENFDAGVLQSWIQQDWGGILVVDNCDQTLHQNLVRQIELSESKFSLLTLHYETSQSDNRTPTFKLTRMDDEFIEKILRPAYKGNIPDLERVVQFAQGFPQMAVLLAEARLARETDAGRLNDDVMLDKLVGGNKVLPANQRRILRACAVFDKFGFEGNVSEEYKFLAKDIAAVDKETFYECVILQTNRGIIGRAGRFAQVVPKPLAIRLAAEWWLLTPQENILNLIENGMPGQLEESFCDQVAMLDFLPDVQKIAKRLCGVQGPFGQAEVILSTRGSRFFRSLVELDPKTTANSIYLVLDSLSDAQLVEVAGDTRRNLIEALEKLCFRSETFEKATWSLMLLASNENESWSNNATGVFKQLFRVFLSGTSAPPDMRLKVIDSILNLNSKRSRILAIEALSSALTTHGSGRLIGAENQGSGEPLKEWRPTVWGEVFDYWIEIIERLTDLIETDPSHWFVARDELGKKIRSVFRSSQVMVDAIDTAIHKIVKSRGPLWIAAVDSITNVLKYDCKDIREDAIAKLYEWERLLTPTELEDRLTFYITSPIYDLQKSETGEYIDYAKTTAENLAQELAHDIDALVPHVPQLIENTQVQGFNFGRSLIIHADGWENFFESSIHFAKENPNPHTEFLGGMLAGIYQLDPVRWNRQMSVLANDPKLASLYPSFLTTGLIQEVHLTTLIEILRLDAFDVGVLVTLGQGTHLDSIPASSLSRFLIDLSNHSPKARWVSLDILIMHCHGTDRSKDFYEVFRKLSLEIPSFWTEKSDYSVDSYHWKEAVLTTLSLENQRNFAIEISKQVIALASKGDLMDSIHVFEPILRALLDQYPVEAWREITSFVESCEYSDLFYLRELLKREEVGERESRISLLSIVPDELIENWCENSPSVGAIFIAEVTEVFGGEDDSFTLSPRATYLIDTFGESNEILRALDTNLGTFTFTNSLKDRFQCEVVLLEPLSNHSIANVRNWANDKIERLKELIENEERIEQEQEIGIF